MTSASAPTNAGGFLTPAPSSPSTSSIHPTSTLPTPRPHALPPRSRAETSLIQYLDSHLLSVSRQHVKKQLPDGYSSLSPLISDLSKLVDIIWLSSTPSLQTQYLLQIANSFNDYLASFPPRWGEIFAFLDKLDQCFHGLVTGEVVGGRKMGMTEKVRLKGVMERTRLHVVKLAETGEDMAGARPPDPTTEGAPDYGSRETEKEEWGEEMEVDRAWGGMEEEEEEEDMEWEIEVSKVYSRTLEEIGDTLQ